MAEIDSEDKSILFELDLNAKQSVADLSRKLGMSRDKVLYRIKKLQADGILVGFGAAINTHKLGLFIYKTYLRLEKNDKRHDELITYLSAHPLVTWIGETDGKWDVIFSMYARSPVEFFETQGVVLLEFSDIIKNFSVYTIVDAHCFAKSYLVGVGTNHYYFGGNTDHVLCDELDYHILRLLSDDCRVSKSDLAEKLDVSPMAIKYRIDRLEESGVLLSYPVSIDIEKLGMLLFKLQIHFGTYERHSEQQLLEFCKSNPSVTMFIRQIGDCMIELEVEVESFQHLNEIISSIRKLFSKFVREIDSIFIRKQKYKWVPFPREHLLRNENRPDIVVNS